MREYSYFKNLKDCLKKDPNHILRKAYSTYCCLGRSLIFLRSIPIINIFFSLSKHLFANPRDYFSLVTLDIITTKCLLTLKLTIHFIFCWVFFSLLVQFFFSFLPTFSSFLSHPIIFSELFSFRNTLMYQPYDISLTVIAYTNEPASYYLTCYSSAYTAVLSEQSYFLEVSFFRSNQMIPMCVWVW